MDPAMVRCFATHEGSNAQYSLRLPTYSSSYIRRYHPYAHFRMPIIQEPYRDGKGHPEPPLDLSILHQCLRRKSLAPAAKPEVYFEPQREAEDEPQDAKSRFPSTFLKLKVINADMQGEFDGCWDQSKYSLHRSRLIAHGDRVEATVKNDTNV